MSPWLGQAWLAVLLVAVDAAVTPLEWPWWWTLPILTLTAAGAR